MTHAPGPELRALCTPLPAGLIGTLPGGQGRPDASYLPHYHVSQLLLHHLGRPYGWAVVGVHESGDEREPVGVVGTLRLVIDGEPVSVDGMGSGVDAKKAESDAFKRAAMKVGVGLQLWAKGGAAYWLDKQWVDDEAAG